MLHTEKLFQWVSGQEVLNAWGQKRTKTNAVILTNELIFTPEVVVNFSLIFAVRPNCMAESVSCNTHPDTELDNIALSIYSGRWAANEWLGHYHLLMSDQPNPRLRKSATQVICVGTFKQGTNFTSCSLWFLSTPHLNIDTHKYSTPHKHSSRGSNQASHSVGWFSQLHQAKRKLY